MPTAPNDAPSCCASVPDPIRDLPSGNDVAVTINLDNGDRGRPQKSGSASRDRKQPLWAGAEPAPKQGNIEPIGERQPGRRAASGLASHHRQSDRSPCEGSVKLSDRHRRSSPGGIPSDTCNTGDQVQLGRLLAWNCLARALPLIIRESDSQLSQSRLRQPRRGQ